jgi:hypothetical protein
MMNINEFPDFDIFQKFQNEISGLNSNIEDLNVLNSKLLSKNTALVSENALLTDQNTSLKNNNSNLKIFAISAGIIGLLIFISHINYKNSIKMTEDEKPKSATD